MLMDGKVGYVIGGLRQTLTKRKLRGSRRKTMREVIGYFQGNRSRMRYDEYLACPFTSALIRSSCEVCAYGYTHRPATIGSPHHDPCG
jgi:hypothetical protein